MASANDDSVTIALPTAAFAGFLKYWRHSRWAAALRSGLKPDADAERSRRLTRYAAAWSG